MLEWFLHKSSKIDKHPLLHHNFKNIWPTIHNVEPLCGFQHDTPGMCQIFCFYETRDKGFYIVKVTK